jgi:hypothetical protein
VARWTVVGVLCVPSAAVFMFFMSETFGGPGEDGLAVMRYDRSVETDSPLYIAFIPYELAIYPIGIPLQAVCLRAPHASNRLVCRTALGSAAVLHAFARGLVAVRSAAVPQSLPTARAVAHQDGA